EAGQDVKIELLHNHPDEAGLVGATHLLPAWMLEGYEAILAVDVGGTNIRAGIVDLKLGKAKDLSKACVQNMRLWRHRDEAGLDRDDAVGELTKMLRGLIRKAKDEIELAPLIGIGCPGLIRKDGR